MRDPASRFRLNILTCIVLLLLLFQIGSAFSASNKEITNVRVYPSSFNPSIGNYAEIRFQIGKSGKLSALILDRDGFVTKNLVSGKEVSAGEQRLSWDGRDDSGEVVADEAWSLKIDLVWKGGKESYFPANQAVDHVSIVPDYYYRENAVLAYKLPVASRVHIQAGSAVEDPKTKQPYGPVLKTVLNRSPRVAGPIVEQWSGFDESDTIYIPDLPNFKVGIAAAPLPENSIVTIGNHTQNFMDYAAKERKGNSQFSFQVHHRHHHMGLGVFDDISPSLTIKPLNASWNPEQRVWETSESFLEIAGSVEGPSAKNFAKQPGKIEIFVDDHRASENTPSGPDFYFKIPIQGSDSDTHIISVNWGSEYGPVAVNNLRLRATVKQARSKK